MAGRFRTRFAPSPNGYLHAGHAFSALTLWRMAQEQDGIALLRIDDIDQSRARPEFEAGIEEDLAWLGLTWPVPVRRQSQHLSEYQRALQQLTQMGVTYPCFCTRKTLILDDHGYYAGTCRPLSQAEVDARIAQGQKPAIRLRAADALQQIPSDAHYIDTGKTIYCRDVPLEDAILARRDIGSSYLLSCVVDDAQQDITHVIRGVDIQAMTALQVALQHLLGLRTPIYHHHGLITDDAQQKLSKSKGSPSLRDLRAAGMTPGALKEMLGVSSG